ncbi:MAG: phosphoglycerate kinase [Candidatus Yanofskybacteria bacterium RIFCSPHIGHO2_02_FULL_41_11]|uniref:Phosphoglycerate kinase n=1 Tax=Candidatus Yanofskybacteria bacterium RIFCSPHIGHO2_02_FULL_41_11 TaxID=1802675 RepID=A0A1F8F9H0_9BACT|nr:MAG: phosphoglycerate kinase [Candidatus Yanofskybacteria bacterium RIFCSPHIGHO2_02_FULL_41_11]
MKVLRDIPDLKNKKVLLRVDFDVPVSDKGEIEENFRIKKQKEVLDYLVGKGAEVIMVAHISDESIHKSFADIIPQLHILLGYEINFIKSILDIEPYFKNYAGPALLENIRQNEGEPKNDPEFAKQLAEGFDIYVNNDFAVCHRNHASVSAVTEYLPSYAGFIIEEEIAQLSKIINAPKEGKIIIIGGAKASTKAPVIKNLLDKSEAILTGGVVANDILKMRGQDVGGSIVDENLHEIFMGISLSDSKLIAPEDYNIFENKILDIGPNTIENYVRIIQKALMIIWNGPMGMFEKEGFDKGTQKIAEAVVRSKAYKIIGGGDTVAALQNIDMSTFNFVSTGGGAMLAFLASEKLPGLQALNYHD